MPETPEELPLTIGIVVDGPIVPAWVAQVVEDLRSGPLIESLHIVFPAELPDISLKAQTPLRASRHAFFNAYLERHRNGNSGTADPFHPVDLRKQFSEHAMWRHPISESNWDVLVWLSSQDPEELPNVQTRLGVVICRHAIQRGRAGAAEYFWELYDQVPVSGFVIECLRPDGSRVQLAESYSATEIGWSLERNRLVPYWKVSVLMLKALRSIATKTRPNNVLDSEQPLPTNGQMLNFLARNAVRTMTRRLLYSHQEPSWFVAFRTNKEDFVSNTGSFQAIGFRKLSAPAGHFYADPFVLNWKGRNYVFVEDYLYAERRGVISAMEFGKDGPVGEAVRVLDLPHHLSYPFVFEYEGELFMIPESLLTGRVELYTAEAPLGPWKLVKVLRADVLAADTTLWIQDGIFYFLTSVAEANGSVTPNDLLDIYWADSLTGEWHAHPQNPVCADVRQSRCAGKLFRLGNKLIRPSQDCSVRYGYAFQLNEVQELTPETFRERPLMRIEPDWMPGLIGTHTFNANADIELIDGQILQARYNPRGETAIARVQSGLRRLGIGRY